MPDKRFVGYDAQGNEVFEESGPGLASQVGQSFANFGKGLWDYSLGGSVGMVGELTKNPDPKSAWVPGEELTYPARNAARLVVEDAKSRKNLYDQAQQDFYDKKYLSAAERLGAWALPFFGPAAHNVVETVKAGKLDEASGQFLGLLMPLFGKALPQDVRVPGVFRAKNSKVAGAMDTALDAGVPLDLGTASDSKLVKRLQFAGEAGTWAGFKDFVSPVVDAFKTIGENTAEMVRGGSPTTPEKAGKTVGASARGTMQAFGREATANYDRLREIAAAHPENVQVPNPDFGKVKGAPPTITKAMDAPIDVRPMKPGLQQMFAEMNADPKYTDAIKANDPGYTAVRNLLEGGDDVPLPFFLKQAEAVGRKGVGTQDAGLRTQGQGLATKVAGQMRDAITQKLAALGADAAEAQRVWDAGRAATREKYATAEVVDALGMSKNQWGEGVKAFGKLVSPRDTNIEVLRDTVKRAPGSGPEIGRAWLESELKRVFANGDADKTKSLLTKWNEMGDGTKAILFPDAGVRQRVGDLVLAMQKFAESPNPSGTGAVNATMRAATSTAHALGPYAAAIGTGGAAASGSLMPYVGAQLVGSALVLAAHNPTVVRALVQGITLPMRGPAQAVSSVAPVGVAASHPVEAPRLSAPAPPPAGEPAPDVVLSAGPGVHTLSDGSVWRVERDGKTASRLK